MTAVRKCFQDEMSDLISDEYPLFGELVSRVCERAPFQKKKLAVFFGSQPPSFFSEAEAFVCQYSKYLSESGLSLEDAAEAYVKLCADMLRYHIRFLQTGEYPISDSHVAYEAVYSNDTTMRAYMMGLAMSQMLWPTHYAMYKAFEGYLIDFKVAEGAYLEIGPGHGAYLAKALARLPERFSIEAVDISETSLLISEAIVRCCYPKDAARVCFQRKDVLEYGSDKTFEFITMGEVLEHVNQPEELLRKIKFLLSPNSSSKAFISTCANAPAADHVVHFKHVDEIRSMLTSCGFEICEEKVLPVENLPMDEVVEKKITVNYCALVR